MRAKRAAGATLIAALALVPLLAGCSSTAEKALSPAQEAKAALASGTLAWQQYTHDRTLVTVTTTTLQDMLKAVTDAEGQLSELPAADDRTAVDALRAVREADDALADALATVTTAGSPIGIGDLLAAATHDLEFAIEALQ